VPVVPTRQVGLTIEASETRGERLLYILASSTVKSENSCSRRVPSTSFLQFAYILVVLYFFY